MVHVYIDESGNLGKQGRYFIIALVQPNKKKRLANMVKRFCASNGLDEIKASALSFPDKQGLFNKLSSVNDYSVSYIVADKKHLLPRLLADNNICFNYLFSKLVSKTIKSSGEDIYFNVDNRTVKVASVNSLSDYIKIKAYGEWGHNHAIEINYVDSKISKQVQVADLVANAIFAKYERGNSHFYNKLIIAESIKFPWKSFGQ
jgi:hypothetical protein